MVSAEDIMSTHLLMVPKTATVQEAAILMTQHQAGSIIVTQNEIPIGIFTETDMTRKIVAHAIPIDTTLDNVATKPLYTCNTDADIFEVAHMMNANHIKKLPVLEGGIIKGIVTQTDIIAHLMGITQALAHEYEEGKITLEQYAAESSGLFKEMKHTVSTITKNWHMKCLACDYRFLALEQNGELQTTQCPKCGSEEITYDKNPTV